MRSVPASLALVILCAGPAPVLPDASPSPKCTEHGQGVRICSELDESALSRRGRSTKLRVWVEGDPRPIQIRLHNSSPGVVRLKGGADQVIHMGCRWHRQVRRKVTLVGPGEPRLVARPYSAFPKREAADIASALAPRLAEIEARFIERRAKPPQTSDDPAAAVSELLGTTETELLDVLNYQELAALRDYVREQFREARADLAKTAVTKKSAELPFSPRSRVLLASLSRLSEAFFAGPFQGGPEAGAPAEPVLDRIGRMLRRLAEMAASDDMTTSLCVKSTPEQGAAFSMRPRSYNKWRGDKTNTEIPNLYRGLYIYRVSKGLRSFSCKDPEVCNLIDLVDDTKPVLRCDLNDFRSPCGRQEGACDRD